MMKNERRELQRLLGDFKTEFSQLNSLMADDGLGFWKSTTEYSRLLECVFVLAKCEQNTRIFWLFQHLTFISNIWYRRNRLFVSIKLSAIFIDILRDTALSLLPRNRF